MLAKLKKKGLVPSAAAGIGFAVLLTALLCLPMAAAMQHETLPLTAAPLCACTAAGISVFAASLIVGKIRKRQVMAAAGIIAGGFILTAAVLCALGGAAASFGAWLWQLCAAVLAGALIGAVMSIRQKAHKRRRA